MQCKLGVHDLPVPSPFKRESTCTEQRSCQHLPAPHWQHDLLHRQLNLSISRGVITLQLHLLMYAISSPRFLLYEDNVLCATYTLPCRPSPCKAFVPEWPSVQGRHVSLWLPRSAPQALYNSRCHKKGGRRRRVCCKPAPSTRKGHCRRRSHAHHPDPSVN